MKIWVIFMLLGIWTLTSGVVFANDLSEEMQLVKEITPGEVGGQLVVGSISDPKTFNIILAGETSSTDILDRMYSGLVELDLLTQEYKPGLAKAWDHSPDYKEWTFYLRRGIRWSDGKPLTAEDVVFTFDVIYNPDIPNSLKDLLKVDGKNFIVTKIDDYTVKVTLPETYGPFLYVIGVPILPKHKLEKAVAEKTFNQIYNVNVKPEELVVNGPFLLDKFVSGEKTVLKRNPFYWKQDIKNQRLPYLENIIFLNVPDINALMLKFQAGETDLYDVRGDRYQTIKEGETKGNYTVYDIGPGLGTEHLWFNLNADKNPETGKPYV
ncbi:MAG: ABC transporter substrate-binding protein, partial [Candidatus Sumerlaeia bacterium]|nr:ABC transporter substrate-binding protein [Candidatus Sumerlaeia bacterium]